MNRQLKTFAIPGLRYILGVVVLLESLRFALSHSAIHQLEKIGLPQWIAPALGGAEALAAILFLAPGVSLVGSYALLFIFAVAAAIHMLHGEFDVGGLIVYSTAVIVCIAHNDKEAAEMSHDR
jgi:hypothetical protein